MLRSIQTAYERKMSESVVNMYPLKFEGSSLVTIKVGQV